MKCHLANNPADAWIWLVKKVMADGYEVLDERGQKTKELTNVLVEILDPENELHPKRTIWTGEKLEIYEKQLLSPENENGFIYTYGNRLRGHFMKEKPFVNDTIDQIQVAIDRLKDCKESRRAVSVTWDPTIDTEIDEVPCLILIDFKIRDGKLITTALWRSHDIFGAWYPNVRGLIAVSKYVAKAVNVPVGKVTIQSISAHVYEHDWLSANKLI